MPEGMSGSGDYVHFKAHVPLHHIPIGSNGTKQWRYYDYGPKSVAPLVCLSGTAGTADVFYKQILNLCLKGYRVIAADAPPVWTHQEWVSSFEKFLDALGVHHVHLYGTSLGGFLAQMFAQHRPRRVKSLLLSNTFVDNHAFQASMSWSALITWTPEFVLKRYVLTGIRDGPQEPQIADSIDFVVSQLETLSRDELASRLTLNTLPATVGQLGLADSSITIMDTNDYCAVPSFLKDQVGARYPGARRALLKSGGDFPFLSRADEVNLHAQLHLRRAGVEGALQLVPAPLTRTPAAPKQEERKREEKATPTATIEEDTKKKGIIVNGSNTMRQNLFPSNSAEESKSEERSSIMSEERLPDLKKKGLSSGSSMKRLNSGSLFMSGSGSGSFHRNGDPLGPLGNDLLVPQRAFMRPNGPTSSSLVES
jgi:maspardin